MERPPSHTLSITLEALKEFAKKVGFAAESQRSLDAPVLEQAQRIHAALFQGKVRDLVTGKRAASGGRLLMRLWIEDPVLQRIPWEALCRPGTSEDFLGVGAAGMLVVRGVTCTKGWSRRTVDGALRVRGLAPSSEVTALDVLRDDLAEPIESGAITWLDPIAGEQASSRYLLESLRRGPSPHVLHFLGHGGVDHESGHPTLGLANDEHGNEGSIKAEVLAGELAASFGDDLRLIVLESCEGARPGMLGSAAEVLARAGLDAVIAHLWPVKCDAARTCSRSFYRALTAGARTRGDVAASLAAARRSLLLELKSAEGFSPVVYMRSLDSVIFEFAGEARPELRRKAEFHVPFLRNPSFVGRADDLSRLHDLLQKGEAVGVRPVSLTGMGGIGKTQMAVEYAYRYRDAYPDGIYWVNAAESWQGELAALAEKVELCEDGVPEADRQRRLSLAMMKYLDERPGALAVFDNVEDPRALRAPLLHGVIPAQLHCRLLFTTRRREDSAEAFPAVDVGTLPEDESLRLLLADEKRRGIREGGDEDDIAAARAICRILGRLPLALALAGAYLGQHDEIALADYRDRLLREGALAAVDDTELTSDNLGGLHILDWLYPPHLTP